MIEAQRRAYLEAMGIDTWIDKTAAPDADQWVVGPGSGDTLLLCRTAQESETRLAADIGRSLGGDPVWAWPDAEGKPESSSLRETVDQFLFKQVILFGRILAGRAFNGRVPEVIGSAEVQVTADLDELAADGMARRTLWQRLSPVRVDEH